MRFVSPARWEIPLTEASALQRELADRVSLDPPDGFPSLAAGVDLAFPRFTGHGRVAVVVWRTTDGEVVEQLRHAGPVPRPYVPGFLAFREGPLIEEALGLLSLAPDVLLVDGHGIAHPRGLGIAAHLGVLLDRPVIGVAKSPLWGEWEIPAPDAGSRSPLRTPDGRVVGTVLRTRAGSRPVWVSPGHRASVEWSCAVVERCLRGKRLPEPLHLADRLSRQKA